MMDAVGLDTVAKTERHFIAEERGEEGEGFGLELELEGQVPEYLAWLEKEYVQRGRLGEKSGRGLVVAKGGGKGKGNGKEKKAGEEVWQEHAVDLSGL
jgi:3-hydroxyacyl-CoA dehydrogenase